MNQKIAAIQQQLKEQNIDCFLVGSAENRRYLTGFSGTFGWVLISQKEAWFFTDSRYTLQAKEQVKDCRPVLLEKFDIPFAVKQIMDSKDLATIALEAQRVTVDLYQKFVNQFGRKAVIPVDGWVEALRMIKTDEEIEMIAKAEAIGDQAFAHILTILKPGIREKDVALELEYFMKKQGASATSFETIVASGARSAMPHGVASDKKIEAGDFVVMDYGCIYNGYCSDMTRTVAIGSVDEKQKTVYNWVLQAQLSAIDRIKAGVLGKEVDEAARAVFRANGVERFFGHGLGHSLGLEIHEEPRFSLRDEHIMQKNMVLTVEPGLYMQGFGVRIEDVVVITEDGCVNITHSPKELIVV